VTSPGHFDIVTEERLVAKEKVFAFTLCVEMMQPCSLECALGFVGSL